MKKLPFKTLDEEARRVAELKRLNDALNARQPREKASPKPPVQKPEPTEE